MKFNDTQEKFYERTVTTGDSEKMSAFQHIVNLINNEQLNHNELFTKFNLNNPEHDEGKFLNAINEHIQMEEFLILKACDLNLNTSTGLNIL